MAADPCQSGLLHSQPGKALCPASQYCGMSVGTSFCSVLFFLVSDFKQANLKPGGAGSRLDIFHSAS